MPTALYSLQTSLTTTFWLGLMAWESQIAASSHPQGSLQLAPLPLLGPDQGWASGPWGNLAIPPWGSPSRQNPQSVSLADVVSDLLDRQLPRVAPNLSP